MTRIIVILFSLKKKQENFKIRGMFGGSGALSVSAGITLVFVFGAILPNWRWVCIGCGVIPVLVISLMPFLPETPNYLVMTGNREEAYKALSWLRGEQHDIEAFFVAFW